MAVTSPVTDQYFLRVSSVLTRRRLKPVPIGSRKTRSVKSSQVSVLGMGSAGAEGSGSAEEEGWGSDEAVSAVSGSAAQAAAVWEPAGLG